MKRQLRSRRQRLHTERLEDRLLLSSDGAILGADARLTLSFAPDGTGVAGQSSALFHQMDAIEPSQTWSSWQSAIIAGFQTWASLTNGDIGQVSDDRSDFGVAGRVRHDPRFGDIRIGSISLHEELLATSVSAVEVIDGTWTGEVLFNSDMEFKTLDDVFALALHEAGHVFGLEHSDDPLSPMHQHGIPTSTAPTADDIANLQQVFGQRVHDYYDLEANGNAAPIELTHFSWLDQAIGTAPTVVFGDITDLNDRDDYYLEMFDGYSGTITFELIASGVSQLSPRITITDQDNFEYVDATLAAGVDGSFIVHDVAALDQFDIRVESGTADPSGIGGYTLLAWFDAANDPASTEPAHELARVPIRHLDQDELAEFFEDGGQLFANDDDGQNNGQGFETELQTAPGFEEGTRYLQYASIDQLGDVDRYSVETVEQVVPGQDWARFSLRSVEGASFAPEMAITDDQGNPVQVEYLVRNAELSVVQFGPFAEEQRYFVEVSAENSSVSQVGNYELDLLFGTTAIERADFVTSQLSSQHDDDRFVLKQRRPQLFHFGFAVNSAADDVVLRMRILDVASNEVARIETTAGDVQTAAVFLPGRHYRVIVDAISGTFNDLDFQITGSAVDDPLGPVAIDTTVSPFDFDEERIAILIASIFGP